MPLDTAAPAIPALSRFVAHAGGGWERPENTMAAFARAAALGVTIETDVRLTSDGVMVLVHDPTTSRVGTTTVDVASTPLAALQAIDVGSRFHPDYAGERIPTMAAAIAAFPQASWQFENKLRTPAVTRSIASAIMAAGLQDRAVYAEFGNSLRNFLILRDEFPAIRTLAYFQQVDAKPTVAALVAARVRTVSVQAGVSWFDAAFVAELRAAGIEADVWTLETRADLSTSLAMGVERVLSNHPAYVGSEFVRGFPTRDRFARNNPGLEWTGDVYTAIGPVGVRFNHGFVGTGTVAALDGRVWGTIRMLPEKSYRITTTLFPRALVQDDSRWAALQVLAQDRSIRLFNPVPAGMSGLNFRITQAGRMSMEQLAGGSAAAELAGQASTGGWVVDQGIPLEIVLTPGKLTFKRTDTSATLTASTTAFRGGSLGVFFSSTAADFGPITIEQM